MIAVLKMGKAGPAEKETASKVPREMRRRGLGIARGRTSLKREEQRSRPRGKGKWCFLSNGQGMR